MARTSVRINTNDLLPTFPTPLEAFKQGKKIQKLIELENSNPSLNEQDQEIMLSPVTSIKSEHSADNYYIDDMADEPSLGHQESFQGNPGPAGSKLQQLFRMYDTDGSNSITPLELQRLLTNQFKYGSYSHFQESTIRLMYSLFNKNKLDHLNYDKATRMVLSFHEFVKLWHYLNEWYQIYLKADANNSNSIDYQEYIHALKEVFGERDFNKFFLSNLNIVTINFKTFCNKRRNLPFDSFVESIVWLIRVINCFRSSTADNGYIDDADGEQHALFTLQLLLQCTISLRY